MKYKTKDSQRDIDPLKKKKETKKWAMKLVIYFSVALVCNYLGKHCHEKIEELVN